ncbi:MAG: hypothetical protein Q4F27_01335 [Desulfovibrionaceae bacterium]|nr:hypothetical protein [Desulfovibrionaceae bacterium]
MDKQTYHDLVANIQIANGMAHIDFYDLALPAPDQPPGEIRQYVFGQRLVLPLTSLIHLHQLTGDVIARLQHAVKGEEA